LNGSCQIKLICWENIDYDYCDRHCRKMENN
jgi:hypothetical protein